MFQDIGFFIAKWLSLCWIWVLVILMMLMEFLGTSSVFRIILVAFAIFLILTFQLCPFDFWKRCLPIYWWVLIVYAVLILIVVYLYEVRLTQRFLHRHIASREQFTRWGLEEHDITRRFIVLINPLLFQLAIVVQKNYLQADFNEFTSPIFEYDLEAEAKSDDESRWEKAFIISMHLKNLIFQILEVHFPKILLLIGWCTCVFDMCAFNFIFAVLLTFSCFYDRTVVIPILYVMSAWNQILILLRLFYMQLYSSHRKWDYVGHYTRDGTTFNVTLNTAEWLGFRESRMGYRYTDFENVKWSFVFIVAVTLFRVVSLRQLNYRLARDMPPEIPHIIFPDINYKNCHDGTINMLKYLLNYGFFRFGIELSAIVATMVLYMRMDVFAIIISVFLLVLLGKSRKFIMKMWYLVMVLMMIIVPFQYFMTLGFSPNFWDYTLTRYWNANDIRIRIQQFINQMNLAYPPKAKKLLFDFVLLLCLSRQWRVFRAEKRFAGQEFPGGSNEDVSDLIDDSNVVNPVPDFVGKIRNSLDVYKYLVFASWFYVSLLSTFFAGTMRPTIYSFGYIIWSFLLLWEGQDMFLRPPRNIIFRWNLLIYYNVLIMLFITLTQIFGCIVIYTIDQRNCRIIRLLSLGCVDDLGMFREIKGLSSSSSCPIEKQGLGVGWDCICFFFLIVQQRIFKSYYFFHIVNDAKAQTILADRGATLIENNRHKIREALDSEYKLMLNNIEVKLKKIKANKKKINAIRAGNYTSFDELERDMNIPLVPSKIHVPDLEFDPNDPMYFTEYLTLLMQTDINHVLEERRIRKMRKEYLGSGKTENVVKTITFRSTEAGTSGGIDRSDAEGQSEPSSGKVLLKKLFTLCMFLLGLVESIVVSITALLNRLTKSFREVLTEINNEKTFLKEKPEYIMGERIGVNQIWYPVQSLPEAIINNQNLNPTQTPVVYSSIYIKLINAVRYLFLSYSEWFCYFCVIIRQMYRSDFISLPLLIMVFCWGSLTMPKPSKTFWVTSIAYILIMLLICNFFVMDVVDWNVYTFADNQFYPPTIIGLRRNINTTFNIVMLSVLLFHRSLLQSLGLWKPYVYRRTSLLADGDYELKDQALVPVPEKSGNASAKNRTYTVNSVQVPLGDYIPRSLVHGAQKYAEHFRLFIQQLLSPSSTQLPVDVYTPMFICDLINLFIVAFFFYAFVGEEETMGFVGFLRYNRVPVSFIGVFLCLFGLMVFDRWIYKGKRRFVKLLFHFFQVITFHIWFFVVYPLVTQKTFNETPPVQVFYIFKCLYFLFSAYQIRNGYPLLISYHCLWSGFTLFHRFAFKMYILIPYLFEMRSLLDWTFTDTSLGVSQWFKIEDITNNIFDQMCEREFEELTSKGSGKKKGRKLKYVVGGALFVLLTLTLILPFLIFSLSDTVGVTTRPARFKLSLYLGTQEPVFYSYATDRSITMFNKELYMNLTKTFNNIVATRNVFNTYNPEDIIALKWSRFSLKTWEASPTRFRELVDQVNSSEVLHARLTIEYVHQGHGGEKREMTFGQTSYALSEEERGHLLNMFVNSSATEPVFVPLVLPKFLLIGKDGIPVPLPIMELADEGYGSPTVNDKIEDEDDDADFDADSTRFRSMLVGLKRDGNQLWWEMQEYCQESDQNYQYYLKDLALNSCTNIVIYVFNEKVFSSAISYVTGSGILGMYLIYFMIIFSLIREMMITMDEIWIEDMPNPEILMRKCLEVYVARDIGNFELEEEICEELVFIMRSREICIRLTKED